MLTESDITYVFILRYWYHSLISHDHHRVHALIPSILRPGYKGY